MTVLTVNLSAKVRRVSQGGRDWLVAPGTSIVPGVLPGSQGALYYPPEECRNSTARWDGIPLVLYHPSADGQNVSATHPGILDKHGIGFVRDSRFGQKLQHNFWFDVEKTRAADRRFGSNVLARLENGQPIEISTGLYTENDVAPPGSHHNGRPYSAVARAYAPDHMAVLPDQTGACAIKDGCGVLVNKSCTCNAAPDKPKCPT